MATLKEMPLNGADWHKNIHADIAHMEYTVTCFISVVSTSWMPKWA